MQQVKNSQKNSWLLILMGGSIPVAFILGAILNISQDIVVIYVVIMALLSGATAIWQHANQNASGDEWWQDDSASGWRGY